MERHVLFGAMPGGLAPSAEDLVGAGFRVTLAESTLDFLQRARTEGVDAMILDTRLPWHAPPVICRLLRSQPQAAGLPLVVLVTAEDRPVGDQCLEMGADRVLELPLAASEVAERLRQALASRER